MRTYQFKIAVICLSLLLDLFGILPHATRSKQNALGLGSFISLRLKSAKYHIHQITQSQIYVHVYIHI